jgi:hypothetical protein
VVQQQGLPRFAAVIAAPQDLLDSAAGGFVELLRRGGKFIAGVHADNETTAVLFLCGSTFYAVFHTFLWCGEPGGKWNYGILRPGQRARLFLTLKRLPLRVNGNQVASHSFRMAAPIVPHFPLFSRSMSKRIPLVAP